MDMIRILQLVALAFGVEELCNARKYYKQKKTRWAIASLCVGIFACACAIITSGNRRIHLQFLNAKRDCIHSLYCGSMWYNRFVD